MELPHLMIFVTTVLNLCNGELIQLSQKTLDKINVQTSNDIITQIMDSIQKIVNEQKTLTTVCESKINKTIDSCKACSGDLCQPKPPPLHEHIFLGLVTEVTKPFTKAAKFVTDIGSKLNVVQKLGQNVLGKLSGITKTLQAAFLEGGAGVFSNVINGLESTGKIIGKTTTKVVKKMHKLLTNIGGKIHQGLGDSIGKVGGVFETLGGKINNFGSKIGSQLETIGNGVVGTGKKIGQGVVNTGKKIGNVFKNIFGKRSTRHLIQKRCANSCPECELLDATKNDQAQIVKSICGTSFVSKQRKDLDSLKTLEELYKFIEAQNPVVTKIEYEKTSVDFTGGRVSFKESYVTYQTGKITNRFKFPGMFDISDIDRMGVEVSQEVRSYTF